MTTERTAATALARAYRPINGESVIGAGAIAPIALGADSRAVNRWIGSTHDVRFEPNAA